MESKDRQDLIETDTFCIGHGRFALMMLSEFGGYRWILLFFLLVAAAIAAAVMSDLRWVAVAAMLVLLIMPMWVALSYFHYGLRQGCYCNIIPHFLRFSSEGIRVVIDVTPKDDKADKDTGTEETAEHIFKEIFFPRESLGKYTLIRDGIKLRTSSPDWGFIVMPYKIFRSKDDFEKILGMI